MFSGWNHGGLSGQSPCIFGHPLLSTLGVFPWGFGGGFLGNTGGQLCWGLGCQLPREPGIRISTQARDPAPAEGV